MYVCVCNAIRDTELRAAARTCEGGPDEVYAALGKIPQCAQCFDEAAEIIIDERTRAKLPILTPS